MVDKQTVAAACLVERKYSETRGYPPGMDKECIPLCDALNMLPGIKTGNSCCGHGERGFYILFSAENMESLFLAARYLQFSQPHDFHKDGWRLSVASSGFPRGSVAFCLGNDVLVGDRCTKSADDLAGSIIYDIIKARLTGQEL